MSWTTLKISSMNTRGRYFIGELEREREQERERACECEKEYLNAAQRHVAFNVHVVLCINVISYKISRFLSLGRTSARRTLTGIEKRWSTKGSIRMLEVHLYLPMAEVWWSVRCRMKELMRRTKKWNTTPIPCPSRDFYPSTTWLFVCCWYDIMIPRAVLIWKSSWEISRLGSNISTINHRNDCQS